MENIIRIFKLPKVNDKGFFQAYLEIVDCIPPAADLSPLEKNLLSVIMYYNYKYKELSKEERSKLIFNIDTKKKIMEEIGCKSMQSFDNFLHSLRKKRFINEDNILVNSLCIIPKEGENNIIFALNVK